MAAPAVQARIRKQGKQSTYLILGIAVTLFGIAVTAFFSL